jgi:EmrB/QacA subfamily drug resistance transporter
MRQVNRWVTLGVLCLAVFTVMVATMLVNVLLPTLNRELDADTRDLLWIVDGFNLVFAAFVLAAGSLSDRFGRKGALITGLGIYLTASVLSATAPNAEVLIGWRALAGLGAAVVFPTTLSIISNVFPDRSERAKAIGLWGAASGASVAVGPIIGGALAESSAWGAAFVFCAVVAGITMVLAVFFVPTSRDPAAPRLDFPGLALSTLALGMLVYTIIEGPERGWSSVTTLCDFGAAACLFLAFAIWENHVAQPMLDVRLFTNLRFTAASGAVTMAFFALFGFIFLITQYFQLVLGWSPLESGVRVIPVATSVAIGSLIGVPLAVKLGTKLVVGAGLVSLSLAFLWVSTADAETSYLVIVGQMVGIGLGMGFTSAPATEAIMGVVPAAKAGIGSAVNDATRELGGTLGVAVIGSVSLSVYRNTLADNVHDPALLHSAQSSLGAAHVLAARIGDPSLAAVAQQGFLDGMGLGCIVAAAIGLFGALLVAAFLPSHPVAPDVEPADTGPAHVCSTCGGPIPPATPAPRPAGHLSTALPALGVFP